MHYTIIPIKSLVNSKKRLESFLAPADRRALVLALLKDVLTAVTRSKFTDGILLVTPDTEIIEIIKKWNISKLQFLLETKELGTNEAVQFAINWCLKRPITSILIIPADLPLISPENVDDLIQLGANNYSIIIAPSQRKDGTNAFYQRPPNLIPVWYGDNSYQKNLATISNHNLQFKIIENPAFALDIDLKIDLIEYQKKAISSNTARVLKTLDF
ncbi:MAG: 2-phospho-L-lactate guanylyltransferase [Candidatus Helarchaeota archaeon]